MSGWRQKLEGLQGPALMLVSIVLAWITVEVSTAEKPNKLAAALLQGITLVFSTYGSYVFGKVASRDAARELLRPHARSAFRRVKNLYRALGRQRDAITAQVERLDELRSPDQPELILFDHALASLNSLHYMAVEQIATADDALEDWRDLVPEEVAKVELEAKMRVEESVDNDQGRGAASV